MEHKFILSCCSTVDLPYDHMESRKIPVLPYTYMVDGVEYTDDMGRDPEARPRFYRMLAQGKLPQTSQINVARYTAFFEELLKQGKAIILISSYLPEVMGLSDRLMVMYEGEQTGMIERKDFYDQNGKLNEEMVLSLASGIKAKEQEGA